MKIKERFRDLLVEKKAFANLATLMPDGSPQVTLVWIDFDGEHLLVNAAKGRLKEKNCAITIKLPYRFRTPTIHITILASVGGLWK